MTVHSFDMSCDEAVLAIWDYLDEEADETLSARVRDHLAICTRCRERFAFEGAFLQSLARVVDNVGDTTPLRLRIVQSLIDHGYRAPPA